MSRKSSTKRSASSKESSLLVVRAGRHSWGVFKRNPWTSGAAIVAILAGLSGAIGGLNYLNSQAEPYYYTSHGYARVLVKDGVEPVTTLGVENQKILKSFQLDYAVGKRETADNNIKQWQFEISKATDDHLKALASNSLRTTQDIRDGLSRQITSLCKDIGKTDGVCQN